MYITKGNKDGVSFHHNNQFLNIYGGKIIFTQELTLNGKKAVKLISFSKPSC